MANHLRRELKIMQTLFHLITLYLREGLVSKAMDEAIKGKERIDYVLNKEKESEVN